MEVLEQNINNNQSVTIKELNKFFGSLENFYYSLIQLDYFLPEIKSGVATASYLLGIIKGDYWCPKNSEIKPGGAKSIRNLTKVQLFELLVGIIEEKNLKDCGFSLSRLPSKQYLLDVIYVLDRENDIFQLKPQEYSNGATINFPFQLFQGINTQVLPSSGQCFIRRTKDQQKQDQIKQIERKIEKKKYRITMLQKEEQKANRKFTDLLQNLDRFSQD